MTTVWRPDLERIRAEIAAEAELELELKLKLEASDGDGEKQGTKRKRAPRTKGPCEHGVKPRSKCKVCSACPHGRRRRECKECGGAGICEHGRRRRECKECGGGSICEHGRQRSQCKECGGGSICEHGRQRSQCKECGGSQICEHGRRRRECKECKKYRTYHQSNEHHLNPARADITRWPPSRVKLRLYMRLKAKKLSRNRGHPPPPRGTLTSRRGP